jgi:hypothetical protein
MLIEAILREAKISLTDAKLVMANDHHQANVSSIIED